MFPRLYCVFLLLGFWTSVSPWAAAEPIISEFTAAGQTILADEDGAYHDFIEIYNPDPVAVDLTGWHLTDHMEQPRRWTFPSRILPPSGYLVVFASAKNRAPAEGVLHTNFRLSSAGETLALTRPDGSVVQALTYHVQIPEVSYDGAHFLRTPTPGAGNSTPLAMAEAPLFSAPHGFRTAAFVLTLSSPQAGATLRYTLDGSEPTETHGSTYSQPLAIAKTTVVRAAAFMAEAEPSPILTRTYLFAQDVVKQAPDGKAPPGWPRSWGANAIDYGMDPRISRKAPYQQELPADLQAIPSLSIVLDLPDLFDPVDGIYANPGAKGTIWERPMSLELIDPAGGAGFQSNAGLRIRGGASRDTGNPKHSFRILFQKEYGAPVLKYPLFGPQGAETTARFDLRWDHLVSWHYSNDPSATQLPDIFGRDTQLATGSPAKRGAPYHLYINGYYWGVYYSDERVTGEWAAAYYGGGSDDYDVMKYDGESSYGTGNPDGTPAAWRRLVEAGRRGFRSNADYYRVQGCSPDGRRNSEDELLLDVDNLIDYMLVGYYSAATDNPSAGVQNNWYAFRSRQGDFGFRFFVHDFELSLANEADDVVNRVPSEDSLAGVETGGINPWHFWEALRSNPEFRLRVADHVQRLFFGQGVLTPAATAARYQARMDELDRAMVAESARWGQPANARGGPIFQAAEEVRVGKPGSGDATSSRVQYTQADWRRATQAKLDVYFPVRTSTVLRQLTEANLFPQVAAPLATSGEGNTLLLANPNPGGVIYYTLDGSDPRQIGGAVVLSSLPYTQPLATTTSTVRARVLQDQVWSPLLEHTTQPVRTLEGLRFTELHYQPTAAQGGDDAEFLELQNRGQTTLDLGGLQFTAGITYTFPAGSALPPGAFWVLARNGSVFSAAHAGLAAQGIYSGKLANEGETLTLAAASGEPLLSVEYKSTAPWPRAAAGVGFSLVATDLIGDASDAQSWRASSVSGGSPGAEDPAAPYFPPVVINEILAHEDPAVLALSQDAVELYNPRGEPASLAGWSLTNDFTVPLRYRLPAGTTIPPYGYLVLHATDFAGSGLQLPAQGGEVWLFSAQGSQLTGYVHGFAFGAQAAGVTFGRYVTSDGRERLAATSAPSLGSANPPPLASQLRFSELHYHPLPGDDEFVEIENTGSSYLDLSSIRLNGLSFSFPNGTSLIAGGLGLVVTVDPAAFRTKYAVPSEVPIFGPASGNLADGGEEVSLDLLGGAGSYQVLEGLRYNDKRPWPTTAAGFGDSLQRLGSSAEAAAPEGWAAGTPTPGRRNTIHASPRVTLTSPRDLSDVSAAQLIHMTATAEAREGQIERVQFLVDGEVVGEDRSAPYACDWHPTSGLHDLTARAFDTSGAFAESEFVTIDVQAVNAGIGSGLQGEYFPKSDFSGVPVVRQDASINFDWAGHAPLAGVPARDFSVRWTGQVQARSTGTHVFELRVLGHARLYLGTDLLIDGGNEQQQAGNLESLTGSIELTAGELRPLRLEYSSTNGVAHVELRWAEPGGFDPQLLTGTQLYGPTQDPTALGIAMEGDLPARQVQRNFRLPLQGNHGHRPYSWAVSAGTLPAGVSLAPEGVLSGAAEHSGVYHFTVQLTDARGAQADRAFTLPVVDRLHPGRRPAVQILAPTNRRDFAKGDPITCSGTATGVSPVQSVQYALNGGPWHTATGTALWSFPVNAARGWKAGLNTVQVTATDREGRVSLPITREFTRVVWAPLHVAVRGAGTVTPGFLGQTLRQIGSSYEITATPAPGWLFTGWEPVQDSRRRLQIEMAEGLQLTATFVPSPFPAVAGTYTGLLDPFPSETIPGPGPIIFLKEEPAPAPTHQTRGFVSTQLSAAGQLTGKLQFAGRKYVFKGRASPQGEFFFSWYDPQLNQSLYLLLNLAPETRTMTARLDYSNTSESGATGGVLGLSRYRKSDPPCPLAGTYAVTTHPDVGSSLPPGNGTVTLTIQPDGRGQVAGALADGTPLLSAVQARNDGVLVLYSDLYGGMGSFSGALTFDVTTRIGNGSFLWTQPGIAGFTGTGTWDAKLTK